MKTYKKYKDSGVEWIGALPEHWGIIKISHSFKTISSGTTPPAGTPKYYANGTIPWVNTGDLNDGLLENCAKKVTVAALHDYTSLTIYPQETLLVAMYGATIGKIALLNINACTNQACCVLRDSDQFNMKFIFYWFLANRPHIISMSYGGGQPNINQGIIKSLRVPAPPLKEQAAIAAYLDQKTAEIDALIAGKKKLKERLQEKRTALINQTVTKGLTAGVKLKQSGVAWIGAVPVHWQLKRLKYCLTLISEKKQDSLLTKIALENIESWTGKYIKTTSIFEGDGVSFKQNDILFGKLRPYLAKVLRAEFAGKAVGDIFVYRPNKEIVPQFSFYKFISCDFIDVVNGSTFGAKMPRASSEFIGNILFPLPPLEEQAAIAAYLDEETAVIDKSINIIKTQLKHLQNYRAALIAAVVTGKLNKTTAIMP